MTRLLKRTLLTALTVAAGSACASMPGPWGGPRHDQTFGPVEETALCTVRVQSAYDIEIEAGVRAGGEQHPLGTLGPNDSMEIGVPCAYQAVTVFRVVRDGGSRDLQLNSMARAIDPSRTTTFVLGPAATRE